MLVKHKVRHQRLQTMTEMWLLRKRLLEEAEMLPRPFIAHPGLGSIYGEPLFVQQQPSTLHLNLCSFETQTMNIRSENEKQFLFQREANKKTGRVQPGQLLCDVILRG